MDYGEVLRGLAVGGWGVEVYDRGGVVAESVGLA